MKKLLFALLFFAVTSCKEKALSVVETKIINDSTLQAGTGHTDTVISWKKTLEQKMSDLKTNNIYATEHIYSNAWIDGCNAVIEAENAGVVPSSKYLDKVRIKDSTIFSLDFRKRNNR